MNHVIANAIEMLGNFFVILLFIRVIMTWIPFDRDGLFGKIFGFLSFLVEPILLPIRSLIQRSPLGGGMIDFSPILAFALIRFATAFLASFVRGLDF